MTPTKAKATETPLAEPVDDVELTEIERLRKENEALKAQVSSKDAELGKYKARGEGWLVLCKNAAYNGMIADVQFTDGMAFIQKNRKYPRFPRTPLSAEQRQLMLSDKQRYPRGEAEVAAIDESVKITSAEFCVKVLVNDYECEALYFKADDADALEARMTKRAQERMEVEKQLSEHSKLMDKIIQEHRVGIIR